MSVEVHKTFRVIVNDCVEVKSLGIRKICVWNWARHLGPIGRYKAAQTGGVVAGTEVVEAGFGVAFFAGEFVVVHAELAVPFLAEGEIRSR